RTQLPVLLRGEDAGPHGRTDDLAAALAQPSDPPRAHHPPQRLLGPPPPGAGRHTRVVEPVHDRAQRLAGEQPAGTLPDHRGFLRVDLVAQDLAPWPFTRVDP